MREVLIQVLHERAAVITCWQKDQNVPFLVADLTKLDDGSIVIIITDPKMKTEPGAWLQGLPNVDTVFHQAAAAKIKLHAHKGRMRMVINLIASAFAGLAESAYGVRPR